MPPKTIQWIMLVCGIGLSILCAVPAFSGQDASLLGVTPAVKDYALGTVKPVLDEASVQELLPRLLKVAEVIIDPEKGVGVNKINPNTFMTYDMLNKVRLGFFAAWKLTPEQQRILAVWHEKYMHPNPPDVFFAPSADEIISNKAAFGCSHYARAFIAVVNALGLVEEPTHLRYVVACSAVPYNQALAQQDTGRTINGHQFVMVKNKDQWIAINTSKAEWTAMPDGFSPDQAVPPKNIPVRFAAYPDKTLLLRKIGKDWNDDCRDGSLRTLMNLYRSGDSEMQAFRWERYPD